MNFFRTALLVILCAVYCMADYSFDNLVVRRMPPPDSKLTQGDVRVLVVLVEFSDVHFTNPDPVSQFTDYLNKEGYNEYYNIGSVRDYFIKNSMGKFKPTFDVYGPVTLPGMQADYGNVRLFLCLHLTDMYKDEYQVKKMETTVNNIEPHSVADFGRLQLDYEIYGKKKNSVSDIVSVRAVIMTDSLIIWVDEDKVKRTNILDKIGSRMNRKSFENKDFFYMDKTWNGKRFADFVRSATSAEMKDRKGLLGSVMGSKNMAFHFPRILDGLNPYFSFGLLNNKDAVMPVSVVLNGDHIDVEFEKQTAWTNTVKPLYISSAEGVFYMDVSFDANGDPRIMSTMSPTLLHKNAIKVATNNLELKIESAAVTQSIVRNRNTIESTKTIFGV